MQLWRFLPKPNILVVQIVVFSICSILNTLTIIVVVPLINMTANILVVLKAVLPICWTTFILSNFINPLINDFILRYEAFSKFLPNLYNKTILLNIYRF